MIKEKRKEARVHFRVSQEVKDVLNKLVSEANAVGAKSCDSFGFSVHGITLTDLVLFAVQKVFRHNALMESLGPSWYTQRKITVLNKLSKKIRSEVRTK